MLHVSVAGRLLAAIPSPGADGLSLGPVELRAYGLLIGAGVLAAVWLAQRRWASRGGDVDDIAALAIWAVPFGLVGARLYHVLTDWPRYEDNLLDALAIWEGGLGIPGGIAVGVLAGLTVARRRGLAIRPLLDAATPALPLAQAIGRWGNWFNQELFGRPTDLPWGLQIDPENRPAAYAEEATFHPAFLYESLWNLSLAIGLIALDRRRALPPGRLLAVYVGGYAAGRLWIETLRVDESTQILGLRLNIWTMGVLLLAAAIALLPVLREGSGHQRAGLGDQETSTSAADMSEHLSEVMDLNRGPGRRREHGHHGDSPSERKRESRTRLTD